MVSPQATQDGKSSNDSVRITAEDVPLDVRRQIIREHNEERWIRQRAVVDSERADRKTNPDTANLFTMPDLRVSNAIAVLQDIAAEVSAYTDNREFGASAVTR